MAGHLSHAVFRPLRRSAGWRCCVPTIRNIAQVFGYLLWVTAVREGVDRLLPVASVGGGVVGVRLLRWRGLAAAPVGATVIVEMVTTLVVVYLFTALGLVLLLELNAAGQDYRRLLLAFALTLPVPVLTVLLLRYGSAFGRLQKFLGPLVGESTMSEQAASLDHELRACLRRGWRLLCAAALQFAALICGCFEIWFALRLFGHPVGWGDGAGAREHDSGGAASGIRRAGRPRRARSRAGHLRARLRHQQRIGAWRCRWPSAFAKCFAACRR